MKVGRRMKQATGPGLLAAAIIGAGCSSGYKYLPPPATSTTADTGVDASLDTLQTPTSPLAEQSKRDVDLILQRRVAADTTKNPPPTAAASKNDPARSAVVWNDPKASQGVKPAAQEPLLRVPPESQANPRQEVPGGATEPVPVHPSLNPDRLQTLMVEMGRELYANGAYSDVPMRQLLMIAAMSMVDPDRTLDAAAIPDLSEKERELLGKLQAFFAELGRSLDGSHDVEQTIVEAVAKLRESIVRPPTLKLTTAALCTRVGGFGDYSQFSRNAFMAHSEQKVIVYLEIDEFTSALNDKGEYVTELAQQLTIYADRDGIPVWGGGDWQTAVDVTKVKRKDFFTVQVVTLPAALSVGKYQLKVRVRDEKSGAEAETAISFEMVADPKMTSNGK